jgi:hypothetical protein
MLIHRAVYSTSLFIDGQTQSIWVQLCLAGSYLCARERICTNSRFLLNAFSDDDRLNLPAMFSRKLLTTIRGQFMMYASLVAICRFPFFLPGGMNDV